MTEDLSLSGNRNRFNQLLDLSTNFVEFPRKATSGFGAAPALAPSLPPNMLLTEAGYSLLKEDGSYLLLNGYN